MFSTANQFTFQRSQKNIFTQENKFHIFTPPCSFLFAIEVQKKHNFSENFQ